jgi:hypothetical protein
MTRIDLQGNLPRKLSENHRRKAEGLIYPSRDYPAGLFTSLTLEELGKASLLDRQETKYLLPKERMASLLPGLESEYHVLEIHGRRSFAYRSVYFDTPDRLFYQQHHAGALPRWKIRQRTYLDTGKSFLEIKYKDNRSVTHKYRQQNNHQKDQISERGSLFLRSCFPGNAANLIPVLETRYTRITLVHKNRKERITFDFQLRFSNGVYSRSLSDLVVAEIKQDRLNRRSPCGSQLKQSGVRPGHFSKYCLGSTLLNPGLKHNRFKPILHQINTLHEGVKPDERPL